MGGVEAREQVEGANGLEDAQVTRQDHPLVKYAEMFTHNFDLIAERKSVVYHLRELAKASVLAKYLLESGMKMEDPWFNLASEISCATCPNVPQLWTKRCHSQIHVQDGKVMEKENGFRHNVNSVYGGVQFGLDRISVDQFRINVVRAAMPGVTISCGSRINSSCGRTCGSRPNRCRESTWSCSSSEAFSTLKASSSNLD